MASPGMAATAMELAATAAVISMTVIFFSSRASMEALWYSGADTLSDTTKAESAATASSTRARTVFCIIFLFNSMFCYPFSYGTAFSHGMGTPEGSAAGRFFLCIKKASRDSRRTPFFVFPFTVLNIRMD